MAPNPHHPHLGPCWLVYNLDRHHLTHRFPISKLHASGVTKDLNSYPFLVINRHPEATTYALTKRKPIPGNFLDLGKSTVIAACPRGSLVILGSHEYKHIEDHPYDDNEGIAPSWRLWQWDNSNFDLVVRLPLVGPPAEWKYTAGFCPPGWIAEPELFSSMTVCGEIIAYQFWDEKILLIQ